MAFIFAQTSLFCQLKSFRIEVFQTDASSCCHIHSTIIYLLTLTPILYTRGLKLATRDSRPAAREPTAACRMIIFDPRLRIKMKLFENIGMFLSEFFLLKT